MSLNRLVPSDVDAEKLAELLDDCRAIPAAAFLRSTRVAMQVVDLTVPTPRSVVHIPEATMNLAAAAEEHFAGFRR